MKPWPLVLLLCAALPALFSCATAGKVASPSSPPATDAVDAGTLPDDGLVRPKEGAARLRVGQVLEIALRANPSTGYGWDLVSDGAPALARTTGPATPPPMDTQPPMPGAPGIARWWFRAERPGAATVRLEYRRPWQKDVPPVEVAEYRITVD